MTDRNFTTNDGKPLHVGKTENIPMPGGCAELRAPELSVSNIDYETKKVTLSPPSTTDLDRFKALFDRVDIKYYQEAEDQIILQPSVHSIPTGDERLTIEDFWYACDFLFDKTGKFLEYRVRE